ncbi:MAG: regulatory protein RecX [Flavobacteriales bacterium]
MFEEKKFPKYSFAMASSKARGYCDKAERSHQMVRNKLIQWGLSYSDREQIISSLIQEDLLNEERFAQAFANDKFRFNHWGIRKIEMALKAKGVSERNIKDAIGRIAPEEYRVALVELVQKRWEREKLQDVFQKKNKVARYFISRGYQSSLVWNILESY